MKRFLLPAVVIIALVSWLEYSTSSWPRSQDLIEEGDALLIQLREFGGVDPGTIVEKAGDLPPQFWHSEVWLGKEWVLGWGDDAPLEDHSLWTSLSFKGRGPFLAIGEYGYGDYDVFEIYYDFGNGRWWTSS